MSSLSQFRAFSLFCLGLLFLGLGALLSACGSEGDRAGGGGDVCHPRDDDPYYGDDSGYGYGWGDDDDDDGPGYGYGYKTLRCDGGDGDGDGDAEGDGDASPSDSNPDAGAPVGGDVGGDTGGETGGGTAEEEDGQDEEDSGEDSAGEDTAEGDENPGGGTTSSSTGYRVSGGAVTYEGRKIALFGVNWFGAETQDHTVHGLWSRDYRDMIDQIKELGFTAVRLPFCPSTLDDVSTSGISFYGSSGPINQDLTGLKSLAVLDKVVLALDEAGIYILFDHHRPDCNAISELWYTSTYSETAWIADLVFVAKRYREISHFIGIDLKNEPHGAATWGRNNKDTDWDSAAERAAAAILDANPDILIFVEGIQDNAGDYCEDADNHWWGGNLAPFACAPLNIPSEKLVFSPHVYGPDVYAQPYFDDSDFPDNLPAIWDAHFGFLGARGYTLAPGEFGGKYGHGGDPDDKTWQNAIVDYFIDREICNFFYWSWNPNSGDTGGILKDDWISVWTDKVSNLKRLMAVCDE